MECCGVGFGDCGGDEFCLAVGGWVGVMNHDCGDGLWYLHGWAFGCDLHKRYSGLAETQKT